MARSWPPSSPARSRAGTTTTRAEFSGAVEMGGLGPHDPAAFVELSGMLTGATMSKVSDCLRTLYEL